jgi:protein involved in polysaccharide export with SLBB domain
MMRSTLVGLCLVILTLIQALTLPARADDRPAYLLGPGDKVRITIYDEPDLSGDLAVSDQGSISMSLIGQVNVAGRTLGEVQSEITQRYAEKYLVNPRVNIDVLNYRPFFILGEVKNPGGYPYVAGMTVVNAIALAGGYTPRGSKRGITIKRTNIKDGKEQSATEDGPVLPGDVIRVPERLF